MNPIRNFSKISSLTKSTIQFGFHSVKRTSLLSSGGLPLLHCIKYNFASTGLYNPDKTVNLPFLADSINEGTIAEFTKGIIHRYFRIGAMG